MSGPEDRLITSDAKTWLETNGFVDSYDELLLTARVPDPADRSRTFCSVNIDGPFRLARAFGQQPDDSLWQDVIEPTWSGRRAGQAESNVHVHVAWPRLRCCRIWYQSPLAEYDCRICFFDAKPKDGTRGDEILWFYAKSSHPFVALSGHRRGDYSDTVEVDFGGGVAEVAPSPTT